MSSFHNLFQELPRYSFELSRSDISESFNDPFYMDIISTYAFTRLRKISFLGAIDYLPQIQKERRRKRHTRYQHSLGVARLALRYAQENNLDRRTERTLVAAALLHDVGHGPLSHSLESFFYEKHGLSHHEAGERIILGEEKIGESVRKTLAKAAINPLEVISLIRGTSNSPHGYLFSGPLNVDTLDGISRAMTYVSSDMAIIVPPLILMDSMIHMNDLSIRRFDEFWKLKDKIYKYLILTGIGMLADNVCRIYIESGDSKVRREDFSLTDKKLRQKHEQLFMQLQELGVEDFSSLTESYGKYKVRNYYIDESYIPKDTTQLYKRYKYRKIDADIKMPIRRLERVKFASNFRTWTNQWLKRA